MQRQDPHELMRDVVERRFRPLEGAIRVDRERFTGKNAAFAVAFDDQAGDAQRVLLGLFQKGDGLWYSTGASSGPPQVARDTDVWTMSGGWGPPDADGRAAVFGGWVADVNAVTARLIDPAGLTVEDRIEEGVAIFMWHEDVNAREARVELLDQEGRIIRSALLLQGE